MIRNGQEQHHCGDIGDKIGQQEGRSKQRSWVIQMQTQGS